MVGAVVEATLKRITFANAQTGYTVARWLPGGAVTWSPWWVPAGRPTGGDAAAARTVESASAVRPAVLVEDYTTVLPATAQGIRCYLGPRGSCGFRR